MSGIKYILSGIIPGLFLFSCFSNEGTSLNKPLAISKTNDLVVVAKKELLTGPTNDTLSYYFESPFPITPNPEPVFNMRYFTYDQIDAEPLRRQLRTYLILIDLSDTSCGEYKMFRNDIGEQKFSEMTKTGVNLVYGRDKWARDQMIIYLTGKNVEDLNKNIATNFPRISEKIYSHDEVQLQAATFYSGENADLQNKVAADLGINMKIPKEFLQALFNKEAKLLWLRRDSKKSIINFMVNRLGPVEIKDPKAFAVSKINSLGKYVSASTSGSALVANDKDLPVLEFRKSINDNESVEFRGIWEMTEDFMGGPYVAYLIKNKSNNDYIFFFGFTYGPGEDKKEHLQQLMAIAKTIGFTK